MKKLWRTKEYDNKKVRALMSSQHISEIFARILISRGFDVPEKAAEYLNPSAVPFFDPYELPDMRKAVRRIRTAIEMHERIVIFGDFDADGITATSLLLLVLRKLGADADYYIPDRFIEGYGIRPAALNKLYEEGASLIITVDNGISAVEEIKAMSDKLTFIVTDHHLPGKELPPAIAVVDYLREDCSYKGANLCGAGIAFKLCQALWLDLKEEELPFGIELAAIGTVADMMPLEGENRKIVYEGMRAIRNTKIIGLKSMLESSGLLGRELSGKDISFDLAPRINSPGRMSTADIVMRLMLTEDKKEADALTVEIDRCNSERKQLIKEACRLAEEQLMTQDEEYRYVLVVSGENWHQGLKGLVASRLQNTYYRPAYVISINDGIGYGSCRSIDGFHVKNVFDAINEQHPQLLIQYGGHPMAGGFSLKEENIDELRRVLNEYAKEHIKPMDFIEKADIDIITEPSEISLELLNELRRMEPCGRGNCEPVFAARGLQAVDTRSFGAEGTHLKFILPGGICCKSWNNADKASYISAHALDLIYTPRVNDFNGNQSVDYWIDSFQQPIQLTTGFLRNVYCFLRDSQNSSGFVPDGGKELQKYLWKQYNIQEELESCIAAIHVFKEIGWLEKQNNQYVLVPPNDKKPDASPLYQMTRFD